MGYLIFANSSNNALVEDLFAHLRTVNGFADCELGKMDLAFHADGEPFVEILTNVRRRNCIVIGCIASNGDRSVNDFAMETFVMLDALKRADAKIDVLLLPYLPYARQDRRKGKATHRTSITAVLFAELLSKAATLNRVCAVEPHDVRIEGFFSCPFDSIPVIHLFVPYVKRLFPDMTNVCAVSPDRGGVERASILATYLGTPLPMAWIDKRRLAPGLAKAQQLVGDVRGRDVVMIDDMIDTAGSLIEAATMIADHGARRILACGVHGLFNGPAYDRIATSPIERVFVTSSLSPRCPTQSCAKIEVIPLGDLLAHAIHCLTSGESLRSLGKTTNGQSDKPVPDRLDIVP